MFEDEETKTLDEISNVNNTNNNKLKTILFITGIVVAILLLIILLFVIFGGSDNKKIVDKEKVLISEKEYAISDTEELILDTERLTITDINNIRKLENLKKLDIKNASLDDISFISDLKKLNVVKINVSTKVTDYSPFLKLNNLFTLEIYGNIGTSADISVFKNLDKISTLYLSFSEDRDLSFLTEMNGLSLLSLDCEIDTYNKISELLQDSKVRISTHGSLSKKDLSTNQVDKIKDGIICWSCYDFDSTEVLLINLTPEYNYIDTLQNELNKISNYSNLKSLTITAYDNSIVYSVKNFDFLKTLEKLENLSINYLNSNDITAISNLSNLKTLSIMNGNMANSKFSSISNLTKLEELNLSMQNITDITFLSNIKNLKTLSLNGNNIRDVSILSNMMQLEKLYLGCNNDLSSYSSISNLGNLNTLMITIDNLDLSIFKNLKNLKNVYVGVSFEKLDEFKTKYPNINIEILSECV